MNGYSKYIDVTKCIGCRACMVACKSWNELPAEIEEFRGTIQSHVRLTANTWNLITFNEIWTEDGKLEWLFRHASCLHCKDAKCIASCRKNALFYGETGAVLINDENCVGCGLCAKNCPYEVMAMEMFINEEGRKKKKARKCTLCNDRLIVGVLPACVTTCPTDAIEYEKETIILEKAQKRLEEIKEKYPDANIYSQGNKVIYLLTHKPSYYHLP